MASSHVAGSCQRLHHSPAAHDRDEEDDGDGFEDEVDEGEEEGDGADVLEGLPGVGVLERLAVPHLAHHDDPQHVHHDSHHRQQNELQTKQRVS